MHALENHFPVRALHQQHPFVAQHARAVDVDDGAQEIFQFGGIKGSIRFENEAFDIVIMVMVVPVARVIMVVRM